MKDCFDPRSYGAVADGHSKDTAAVQAAIDAAARCGWQAVHLSAVRCT